ncbi:MAG: fumarylacetoacetate hydrolase family protein [Pseudorhodoplanes sp.]
MKRSADTIAAEILAAFDGRSQIQPFTAGDPDFGLLQGYAVASAACRMRIARGEKPIGRKIGFTNRGIWAQYNVGAPVWGYMYEHGVALLDTKLSVATFCEPLIEPEIALWLETAPRPGMNERELLECIGWVAHGFEVVQSMFPGWKFQVADTIANFGMHAAYRLGPPLAVTAKNREDLLNSLSTFTVKLLRDGTQVDTGCGSNVLDGPLAALRHLVELLADDPFNPPLSAGEIVTTGTLTRAFAVADGETWSTDMAGIPLSGIQFRFG